VAANPKVATTTATTITPAGEAKGEAEAKAIVVP